MCKINNIPNISGVYQIINTINNKTYIGSSINCKIRCKSHIRDLLINNHCNNKLQNSWDKYGKNVFMFKLLESVGDKSDLLKREQYYLDTLNPEYNICKIAGNTLGVKPSNETKERISISLTDKYSGDKSFNYKGGYIKPKNKLESSVCDKIFKTNITKTRQSDKSGKPIIQYDNDFNIIKEWHSIKSASDVLGISRSSIKRCCDGKDRRAGWFIWRFKGQENVEYKYRHHPILQLDKNNIVISEFDQIVIAAEKLKINRKYISKALKSGNLYYGFYWKYKN